MPSPSPGAMNTPSSSGNGTPKLLNDYVRFQSLFLSYFAHGCCLSNSAIVSGKAHLARSIVRSPNLSPSPAVSSLALRRPQLGHGGDCGRKGDHIGQYTEGRDIPNHGGQSILPAPLPRPLTHTTLPQSEIDLLKNLNVCTYTKSTPSADPGSASEHRQIQGVLQDTGIPVYHPGVCHILYFQTLLLDSVPQVLRKRVPTRHLQTIRKVPGESSSRVHMPGPRRIGISSRPGCNTSRYQGRKYFNKQGRLC